MTNLSLKKCREMLAEMDELIDRTAGTIANYNMGGDQKIRRAMNEMYAIRKEMADIVASMEPKLDA